MRFILTRIKNVLWIFNILFQLFASGSISGICTLHLDALTSRLREQVVAGRRNTEVLIHGDIATVWQAVLIGTRNIICSWPACVLHSRRQKKNSTLSYYVNWQWCKDLDQIPQQIQEWMFRERNCSFASCSPVLWTRSDAKGLPHRLCHRAVLYCN